MLGRGATQVDEEDRSNQADVDIQKVSDLKVMNSGKVRSPAGPWRRGGGRGHPQGESNKHQKQFIPGKDGKREQIVWQSERESGVINGWRNHDREENMVANLIRTIWMKFRGQNLCTAWCNMDYDITKVSTVP